MSKSKPSKKRLIKLAVILLALVLLWPISAPLRSARARSLANQAEQTYPSDPVKAIAMLRTAGRISNSPEITAKLNLWLLDDEMHARPTGSEAVILAKKLAALREYGRAEQVLNSAGPLNTSGYVLLAEIRMAQSKNLDHTREFLEQSIANDPSDIRLHELLRAVYLKLDNKKGASEEAAKIERLKDGRP